MSRRDCTVSVLDCAIGPRERIACDDMKAMLAIDSDANLVRTALHFYAEFVLGKEHVDVNLFRLHSKAGPRLKGKAVHHHQQQRLLA